jgi:glycosyltransferase involved in cell wall biosynthesis
VSCVVPTFNRRRFVPQAVRLLARQDYPHLELVVVDDGTEPVEDLLGGFPRVRYVRLGERATIGRKRDIAVEAASGEIVVQWDDDDWYAPHRVSRQVMEIIRGCVDVTGIGINLMLDVRSMRFWSVREHEAEAPLFAPPDILAAGTLAFPTELWRRAGGYPNLSIGEDVGMVQRFADVGARVAAVSNRAAYVYVRHGRNSWRFDFDPAEGPPAWHPAEAPPTMPAEDLAFYASLTPAGGAR